MPARPPARSLCGFLSSRERLLTMKFSGVFPFHIPLQKTSAHCARARKDSGTPAVRSTASSPTSCARVATSRRATGRGASQSTAGAFPPSPRACFVRDKSVLPRVFFHAPRPSVCTTGIIYRCALHVVVVGGGSAGVLIVASAPVSLHAFVHVLQGRSTMRTFRYGTRGRVRVHRSPPAPLIF